MKGIKSTQENPETGKMILRLMDRGRSIRQISPRLYARIWGFRGKEGKIPVFSGVALEGRRGGH